GATLVVLLLLGVAIYTAVEGSLANASIERMERRAGELGEYLRQPGGRGPRVDLIVGRDSGTFGYVVDGESGESLFRPNFANDVVGAPNAASVDAAIAGQRDVRTSTLTATLTSGPVVIPVRVLSETVRGVDRPLVVQVVQDRTAEVETLD